MSSPFGWKVKSVEGCETAAPGEYVIYTITGYSPKMEKGHGHSLLWAVKVDGVTQYVSSGGSKETHRLYIDEEWAEKEIIVMAQNWFGDRNFEESAGQKTFVTVEPRMFPREVSGPGEANVGDTVEYRVTRYNREAGKISAWEKKGLSWMVKVDGVQEILTDEVGEIFNLEIKKEWDGKEIVVMTALLVWEFDEKVSRRTRVGNCMSKDTPPTSLRIRNVAEVDEKAEVYACDTIELEVTEYNEARDLTQAEKDAIKWDVKIGNAAKTVLTDNNGQPLRGDRIVFSPSKEWEGQLVVIMPYFRSAVESVAVKVRVKRMGVEEEQKQSAIVLFASTLEEERRRVLSNRSIELLERVAKEIEQNSLTVTSTIRFPRNQAVAMYNNLENGRNIRYAQPGRDVVAVYHQSKRDKLSREETINKMVKKIEELARNGQRVSLHCVPVDEYNRLNVIDVSYLSNDADTQKFLNALSEESNVVRVLHGKENMRNASKIQFLASEPCVHIEINQ
jgi:hypothetical protein